MFETIKKDSIVAFLTKKSTLTEAQLDTVLLSQTDGSLKHKAALRDKRKVSEGAFVRTLRQGQANIEASIYTLILLNYLKLAASEDLERLADLGRLISKVKDSSPNKEAIKRLTEALEDLAEGFSRRKRKLIV